jgi:ankyrin repeat protein
VKWMVAAGFATAILIAIACAQARRQSEEVAIGGDLISAIEGDHPDDAARIFREHPRGPYAYAEREVGMERIFGGHFRRPLINLAAHYGNTEIVKMFLDHGESISARDQDGSTPLMRAAQQAKNETVRMLIERGASIRVTDRDGCTPLMHAVWSENPETVRLLLNAGADSNAKSLNGETVSEMAATYNNREVLKLLRASR